MTLTPASSGGAGGPVTITGTVTVDGSAVTQPVSATTLPLPAGAAADATVTAANTHLAAIRAAANDYAWQAVLDAERSLFT